MSSTLVLMDFCRILLKDSIWTSDGNYKDPQHWFLMNIFKGLNVDFWWILLKGSTQIYCQDTLHEFLMVIVKVFGVGFWRILLRDSTCILTDIVKRLKIDFWGMLLRNSTWICYENSTGTERWFLMIFWRIVLRDSTWIFDGICKRTQHGFLMVIFSTIFERNCKMGKNEYFSNVDFRWIFEKYCWGAQREFL